MNMNAITVRAWVVGLIVGLAGLNARAEPANPASAGDSFAKSFAALRASLPNATAEENHDAWTRLSKAFPAECDWVLQDLAPQPDAWLRGGTIDQLEKRMIGRVIAELAEAGPALQRELDQLMQSPASNGAVAAPGQDEALLNLYLKSCAARRDLRIKPLLGKLRQIVFAKHFNMGGSHYAYTEGQSDAQAERVFIPGSALCLLSLDDAGRATTTTLLEDRQGVIRNPDVSFDGKRVLFAWKKSNRLDDYHLYEMDLATRAIRQITFGIGFADYEGCYAPGGQIIFSSTRPVQTVDCFWTEVSNLYACDTDGRHLRRLGFDQVHTNFPTLTSDGRILYTRWDYNDRGQIYPQGLFQMNTDGTAQTEFYGNNSWFPTTIAQARAFPGSSKLLAIATGHHSFQAGKLIAIDPSRGRQESAGVQLAAPVRETPADHIDGYGQEGELFQYPYPLGEQDMLITYHPLGWEKTTKEKRRPSRHLSPQFGVYYMMMDGRRELLAADAEWSCNQPIPVIARPEPATRASAVDYRRDDGVYYVHDVYQGPGLAGVARGSIKKLRVIALDFRAAGIGANGNHGPAGGALVSTPPAIDCGTWDVKVVLGSATVHEDGSACFRVPARTPLYFQAIDDKGRVAQTMRSWSTVQPGEVASCVGCHEDKNSSPPAYSSGRIALRNHPEELEPFYGPARGFSFAKEIQPILQAKCVSCHNDPARQPAFRPFPEEKRRALAKVEPAQAAPNKEIAPGTRAFSLLATPVLDVKAKRNWSQSYLALTSAGRTTTMVNWTNVQGAPPMLPPYSAGSARSAIMPLLEAGHGGAKLSAEELEKFACWIDLLVPFCGDYREAAAWTDVESAKYAHYLAKRQIMQAMERENVRELADRRAGKRETPANAAEHLVAAPVDKGAPAAASEKPVKSDKLAKPDKPAGPAMTIRVISADGKPLAESRGEGSLNLEIAREYANGDRIVITGPPNMLVSLDGALDNALIFVPDGKLDYLIPPTTGKVSERKAYSPEAFKGDKHTISARAASADEVGAYRNLALNPAALRGEKPALYPHATTNSEARDESVFAARNTIDGMVKNANHGTYPNQSWGPDKRTDLWLKIDFGRPVQIDKLVLYLRADFPHDKVWETATVEFSDGAKEKITLAKTAEPQAFSFKARTTSWIRLTDLKQHEPMGWCAITELQAWGRDSAMDPVLPGK